MNDCRAHSWIRHKHRLVFLCVLIVALQLQLLWLGVSYASGSLSQSAGPAIDIYTQKKPYGGKGPYEPSDAFAPLEEVMIYAYVTYNMYPEQYALVAFEVKDANMNSVIFTSALTDANGTATISFRMPWLGEIEECNLFGTWTVVGRVEIAGEIVEDWLWFKVGWIVELLRVETVDANNASKVSFSRGEHMWFKLTLKNIAKVDKVVTLIISAYDKHSVHIGQIVLQDWVISPCTSVHFIGDLLIPNWTRVGMGMVYVNAYTAQPQQSGIPYCPEVSTAFEISAVPLHDVAVISVIPSATEVYAFDIVDITVVVRNDGDETETFDVSAYYDSVLIGTAPVTLLAPHTEKNLTFAWSTLRVPEGNYTISAVASTVPEETDIEDNTYIDGTVTVKPPGPSLLTKIPLWLILLIVALIFVIIAALLLRKKKKPPPPPPRPSPTPWLEGILG